MENNSIIINENNKVNQTFFDSTDIQVTTAKQYPRDISKSLQEAEMMALMSEEIAESCIYAVPRRDNDGKEKLIQGPSIRLAEIVSSAWGNLHMASEIKENNGSTITARAYCWDLEKNVRAGVEVKRSIVNKYNKRYSTDMQIVTGNAACSIALRNAIFKVIPKGYVESLLNKCRDKSLDNSKFTEKRNLVFERLNNLGVNNELIFSFYNKYKIEDFNEEDIKDLIGVGTAIKDGYLPVDQAFRKETKSEKILDILNEQAVPIHE